MRRACLLALVPLAVSCTGTTQYDLVTFYAAAVGPADATPGQMYTFTNDHGFKIQLKTATIHIGAVYLDQSVPTSGQQQEPCTLPGLYVGEVRGGRDFDMLSPSPQLFPVAGDGSTIPATAAQVWLTHGDVFAAADPLPVLTLEGYASRSDIPTFHFEAGITIDQNSAAATMANTALPGENPICQRRIVSPILVDLTLGQSGTLLLHLDPKALFTNVDFSDLSDLGADPVILESDGSDQPSRNIILNMRAAGAVYRFEWQPASG